MQTLRLLAPLVASAIAAVSGHGIVHAQSPAEGPRIVEARTVPELPSLAEPFVLEVVLRSGPGWSLELPDTLAASEHARSVGPGSWTTTPAAGDSVDVLAHYPVVAFVAGPVLLPSIELRATRSGAGDVAVTGSASGGTIAGSPPEPASVVGLGAVQVAPFAPFEALLDADSALVPRGPADVLGRDWGLGVLAAAILTSLVAVAVAMTAARRWWLLRGLAMIARLRGGTPRQVALRRLEEIRSTGWHRNGRIDAFYAGTTDALRRYAGQVDPAWGPATTSSELVAGIAERWGDGRSGPLRSVIDVSERVKFGGYRPDPESAEADWRVIRDWVREAPES